MGRQLGVVLYNNGPTTDVRVVAQGIHGDAVVDRAEQDFTHVPADSFFVYGGEMTELKAHDDTIEVVVSPSPTGGRMRDVDLTTTATVPDGRSYQNVSLQITNAGSETMPDESAVYLVLVDAEGTIVGGTNDYTSVPVPGGQTVRDVVADVRMQPRTAQILAYVDLLNSDRMFR